MPLIVHSSATVGIVRRGDSCLIFIFYFLFFCARVRGHIPTSECGQSACLVQPTYFAPKRIPPRLGICTPDWITILLHIFLSLRHGDHWRLHL
ncbi:hypothetical protein GQ44DRAFT_701338 [Phaeosphaeriaceae sp. PMI808]|nr:hypothetical protein GQ44DRAFT_701338 [Phaeosphaeriaceae sp. PMI808]